MYKTPTYGINQNDCWHKHPMWSFLTFCFMNNMQNKTIEIKIIHIFHYECRYCADKKELSQGNMLCLKICIDTI